MITRAIGSGICWLAVVAVFVLTFAGPQWLVEIISQIAFYTLGACAAVGLILYFVNAVREGLRHSSPPSPR